MSVQTIGGSSAARRKPAGGFQFIAVPELASAWWAYTEGLIRIPDLRAWFACHEAKARRCGGKGRGEARFNLDEIRGLTGVPVSKLRGSIGRLEAAGLLAWSESALSFGDGHDLGDGFATFLSELPNNARRVPVPRRIVRLIAGGSRPALIACILGHLLRCLYYRKGSVEPQGRCKASWIAQAFGVSLRRVKEARAELLRLGWLITADAPQWQLNRWGAWVSINLDWHRLDGVSDSSGEPKSAPPRADSEPKSAPPKTDKEPLRENKNQKPAAGGPSGFSNSDGQGGENPPTLRDVVPADLRDTGRLLSLYAEAVRLDLVRDSDSERLKFVAAAEHARVIGTKNPCGLFVRFVRGKLWNFLTHDDEDAANRRLNQHFRPRLEIPAAPPVTAPRPVLSEDARMVQAVENAAKRVGFRGDAFYLLRKERPDWTRDRWEAASLELAGGSRAARVSELASAGAALAGIFGSLGR
jgi:hypothetical protein